MKSHKYHLTGRLPSKKSCKTMVSRPNGQICPTFLHLLTLYIYFQKGPEELNSHQYHHIGWLPSIFHSTSPIKGSKSHAEHWFLVKMSKSIQLFLLFDCLYLLPKRSLGVEIPQISPHGMVAIYFPIPLVL